MNIFNRIKTEYKKIKKKKQTEKQQVPRNDSEYNDNGNSGSNRDGWFLCLVTYQPIWVMSKISLWENSSDTF